MTKNQSSKPIRDTVIEHARNCCEYCKSQRQYSGSSFELDHIHPVSLEGETSLNNLALACGGCNRHKSNKTQGIDPATGETVSLFNPRSELWENHFGWVEGYTQIIGLTPVGRATVEALKLNRIGLVNMRQVLYMVGKHPPH